VVWEKFVSALSGVVKLDKELVGVRLKCAKVVIDEADTGFITIYKFSEFLKWFGPLCHDTFENLYLLLQKSYVLALNIVFHFELLIID
jgi:hypothetical protein